ncbi:hypothetical protein KY285_023810 [Solanum tuberosum]|nr:hypothetical protein KY285_023810 [Solanum tuberosum]
MATCSDRSMEDAREGSGASVSNLMHWKGLENISRISMFPTLVVLKWETIRV